MKIREHLNVFRTLLLNLAEGGMIMNENQRTSYDRNVSYALGILVLTGLYLSSLYNYLLFHSLAEIFSILVAGSMFMIAWNSKKYIENSYLIFIAIAYLFNLLGNAVRYTAKGGLVFRISRSGISANPEKHGTVSVCFQVEDTGIGIPEDKLEEIFSPFRQLGNFTHKTMEGFGI